jgi:hypothetical protein
MVRVEYVAQILRIQGRAQMGEVDEINEHDGELTAQAVGRIQYDPIGRVVDTSRRHAAKSALRAPATAQMHPPSMAAL